MEETGCDRSEAELALQLCGYDLEGAVQAIPRLFQNIVILKGRLCVPSESFYGLWLAILNLKENRLLRARAVLSYNPAVYASELDQHWFDFEGRLYACRLWPGTMQDRSQEVEGILSAWLESPAAKPFYEEGALIEDEAFTPLRQVLEGRLGGPVDLRVQQDVLDMGQFQEVRPQDKPRPPKRAQRAPMGPEGLVVLRVAMDPDPEGIPAAELRAGDLVHVSINDSRDIAQYLARLFGAPTPGSSDGGRSEGFSQPADSMVEGRSESSSTLLVPVEAIELEEGQVGIRVRFSAGVCGDVEVPPDIKVRASRRPGRSPWWKKLFGG